jgi:hypothetical protein
MISETYQLSATSTDILAAPSRLSAVPYNGQMILEFQSSVYDSSNNYAVTVQMPDGTMPVENIGIPKGVTAGGINADDKYVLQVPATAGGHVLVSATLTGTGVLSMRATLMP